MSLVIHFPAWRNSMKDFEDALVSKANNLWTIEALCG